LSNIPDNINICAQSGVKAEFSFSKTGFRVIFYRNENIKNAGEKGAEKGLEKVLEKGLEKVLGKDIEKVLNEKGIRLTFNQKQIVVYLLENPRDTNKQLSKKVGISERKIRENIKKLKIFGLLSRIGPDKGGYWKVIKSK